MFVNYKVQLFASSFQSTSYDASSFVKGISVHLKTNKASEVKLEFENFYQMLTDDFFYAPFIDIHVWLGSGVMTYVGKYKLDKPTFLFGATNKIQFKSLESAVVESAQGQKKNASQILEESHKGKIENVFKTICNAYSWVPHIAIEEVAVNAPIDFTVPKNKPDVTWMQQFASSLGLKMRFEYDDPQTTKEPKTHCYVYSPSNNFTRIWDLSFWQGGASNIIEASFSRDSWKDNAGTKTSDSVDKEGKQITTESKVYGTFNTLSGTKYVELLTESNRNLFTADGEFIPQTKVDAETVNKMKTLANSQPYKHVTKIPLETNIMPSDGIKTLGINRFDTQTWSVEEVDHEFGSGVSTTTIKGSTFEFKGTENMIGPEASKEVETKNKIYAKFLEGKTAELTQ